MRVKLFLLVAALTASSAILASSATASAPPSAPSGSCPSSEDTSVVDINLSYGFSPSTLDIAPGTTVCWRNADGWLHDVTSDTGAFSSREIPLPGTYAFTFNRSGSYPYHNARYPAMTGVVTVGAGQAKCPTQASVVHISTAFEPATTTVGPYIASVCWTNEDARAHTVTADDGAFDAGELPPGEVYGFTFNWAGPYGYHDALDPDLTGTVETSGLPPAPPPPAPPDPRFNCPPDSQYVEVLHGFSPPTLRIVPGTTVCWQNQDGWTHTVTSDTGLFDSGEMALAGVFTFMFGATGSYPYHDSLYPSRTGTVEVRPGTPRSARYFVVPSVVGLRLGKAKVRIRRAHGKVGRITRVARSKRVGRVLRQRPGAGKKLRRGSRVNLVIGRR
jgi:plastocyanin